MSTRKRMRTNVWEYFENRAEIGKAACKLCKLLLKNDRTFNLKVHLVKVHQIDLNGLEQQTSSNSDLTPSIPVKKQKIKVQINKKTLLRSYIGLIIEDNVSLKVLDSPNFKNIIEPICDGLGEKLGKRIALNAENRQSTFSEVAENIRASMKMETNNRLLSLIIDTASGLSRNIFGISAQFIKDDEIKSLIMGTVELKGIGASASENLAAEVLRTLQKYDIHLNQIVSITSGNGAHVAEAVNILSSYNMSVKHEPDTEEANLDNALFLGDQIKICKCAIRTLELCAQDISKVSEIKGYLLSCRNFVKFIRKHSNSFREVFQFRNAELAKIDCPNRWRSTYEMIKTLIAAKDALISVESVRNKSINDNFENNDSLWDFMECYFTAFAPLYEAILKLQADHVHYSNFYAQWLKCKILTTKIVQSIENKDLVQKLGSKILESIEKRTSKLLDNKSLNACLFLDPRFHHTLSLHRRQDAVNYLKNLWEKICSVSAVSEYVTSDTTLVETDNKFDDEAEELLNSFLTEKLKAASSEIVYTDVHLKIESLRLPFLRSDTDVLHFWRERKHSEPELYALSSICFGIPPSEITIEQALPSLKSIMTKNLNQLSRENLEDLLLVKLNSTFLDEAINNLPLFEDDVSDDSQD